MAKETTPKAASPATIQQGSPEVTTPTQGSPFYEVAWPDGQKEIFRTKEELDKSMRDSYFRNKDYTHSKQALAEQRKKFEDQQKEIEKRDKLIQQKEQEYREYDWLVRSRPDVFRQLQSAARGPVAPDAIYDRSKEYVDEQAKTLRGEVEAMKKQLEEERAERERESVHSKLKGEYADFDPAVIDQMLEELGQGYEPLARVAYLAHKSRSQPNGKTPKATPDVKAAALMPSSGGEVSQAVTPPDTVEAAREMALKEAGIKVRPD